MRIKKRILLFVSMFLMITALTGCSLQNSDKKIPVKILILPKFEVGDLSGDFPGEAQYFYEEYLKDSDIYEISGGTDLYFKDGIALCVTEQGKVNAALHTSAVLSDERFDFSEAYILSEGCAGSAAGYGRYGDVYVITAAADYDLGHKADPREMSSDAETTWFREESYDDIAVVRLDEALTDKVFQLIKDTPLETTEKTEAFLRKEYPGEEWAERKPSVMYGTSVTGDNYWKGQYDHNNALLITETYGCRDPYAVTEMEDIAVCQAVKQAGMLDRLIILRVSVNMDAFPSGVTPEMLWGEETDDHLASQNSIESVDIFETSMQNCFNCGRIVIDAIMNDGF